MSENTDNKNDVGFSYNPEMNYDEATMAQQRAIEKQVASEQSLIGPIVNLSDLELEYAEDPVYQLKVKELAKTYHHIRKTRGDGNCLFRAFCFAYFESLLHDRKEYERFKDIAASSKDMLLALGFPQFTLEDFHDVFMEAVEQVGNQCTLDELLDTFNDQGRSDYLVVYLRLLVSGHLQKEAEFFSNFVEGGRTVQEFCSQEVEPMGRESDHIHIIALTAATGVAVEVGYMDRGTDGTVTRHVFPDGDVPRIHLLYKPGHYDILYTQKH